MRFAWDTIFGPIIEILKPTKFVEVGAFQGSCTERILAHCRRHDGVVQVIDPLSANPEVRRDQEAVFARLAAENPGRLVLHRARSLPLLDEIGAFDAILIDGDHNWYTVIEELRAVERMARRHGIVPFIAIDDIGWPHGRRDCYFAPETIPPAFLHPHRRGCLIPGQPGISESGPFGNFSHAEHEGGPRNGVRTAVEDFLRETTLDLVCRQVPLRSGTAVLIPRDDGPSGAAIRHWLDAWQFGETQMAALWEASAEHIALINMIGPLTSEVAALRRQVAADATPRP